MIEIKTKSGFEITLDEARLNNMELVDALSELEDNQLALPRVSKLLLGEEGKKQLYDHLRNADGIVPVDAFMAELDEIMNSAGDGVKN